MIDASKSPVPAWKRYATIAILAVLVVVVGYFLYSKELHHSPAASRPAPAPAVTQAGPSQATAKTSPKGIPGGIPISSRNPFQ